MKVRMIRSGLKRKAVGWIMSTAFALGLFSVNVSHAQSTVTNRWIGTTSTNAATNSNYNTTTNGTTGNAATNFLTAGNTFVYSNSYSQSTAQTFNFGGVTNVAVFGSSIRSYASDVVFTNVGTYRIDNGGITATNSSGFSGKAAGTFYLLNTNVSQLQGNPTIQGNMAIYLQDFSTHSSSGRTVTQNAGSLCISNLGVTMANSSNGLVSATLTWSGTGNTTVIGSLFQSRLSSGGTNVTAAMTVQNGTLNLATTNTNNISTNSVVIDGTSVFGWASGLIITNSGSVYISGQNSLGAQMYNVRVGTTNNGVTTLGIFTQN
jgi:hypothetical protein